MEKITATQAQLDALRAEFSAKCKNGLAVALFEKLITDNFTVVK